MTILDSPEGKIITLSTALDNRSKLLNAFYFICFFFAAIGFVSLVLHTGKTVLAIIFGCIIIGVFAIIAFRFINKALQSEKLIVKIESLTIRRKGFFTLKETVYNTAHISGFRFVEKQPTSPHQLAGNTFDYLGFQTEQQLISELHGDNKIAFNYEGRIISFGENIYSWDFDQLEVILYDITGNDFRYDDAFEKNFFEEKDSDNAL